MGIGELLRVRARSEPDKIFWWLGDHRATFAEADARSDRVAAGLAELGVEKGDRVAVLSTNRPEYLETTFALAKLGAIQVPLNAYLRGDFLQYQIDQAEAAVAIADEAGIEAIKAVLERTPSLKRVVALDETLSSDHAIDLVPFSDLRGCEKECPAIEVAASEVASIMYTSGTTGMPKGCMLQHGYYLHIGSQRSALLPAGEDDVLFTALPLFHTAAQGVVLMSALYDAVSVVIEPAFRPATVVERWRETRATLFVAVGAMCTALLQQPPSESDHDHRVHAGLVVPLPPPLQQQFRDRFGVDMNSALYGQTEIWPVSVSLPGEGKPGTQGKPAPYYDVGIVDDTDNAVPPGNVGEIVVRPNAPHAMYGGYWRQPEATVNAWRNLWHHTGDSGYIDEDGFLNFVDRKKDALRRRGENISSMEVEAAITKHPKIAEAAVFGVPSELTEEDVMACLVLETSTSLEAKDLFEYFKTSMPYFVIPRYIRLMDEFPKTAATLRVQKHILRAEGITADTWDLEDMGLRVERAERR